LTNGGISNICDRRFSVFKLGVPPVCFGFRRSSLPLFSSLFVCTKPKQLNTPRQKTKSTSINQSINATNFIMSFNYCEHSVEKMSMMVSNQQEQQRQDDQNQQEQQPENDDASATTAMPENNVARRAFWWKQVETTSSRNLMADDDEFIDPVVEAHMEMNLELWRR
jgi:hypothetical protein